RVGSRGLPRLVATVIVRRLRGCALLVAAAEVGTVRSVGTVTAATTPMSATSTMHPEAILTAVALVVAVRPGILLRVTAAGDERRQAAELLVPAFMATLAALAALATLATLVTLTGLLIRLLLLMLRPIVHLLIAWRERLRIARQIRLLLRFARRVTWLVLAHERLGVIIVAVE